jgi:hypothetical protein
MPRSAYGRSAPTVRRVVSAPGRQDGGAPRARAGGGAPAEVAGVGFGWPPGWSESLSCDKHLVVVACGPSGTTRLCMDMEGLAPLVSRTSIARTYTDPRRRAGSRPGGLRLHPPSHREGGDANWRAFGGAMSVRLPRPVRRGPSSRAGERNSSSGRATVLGRGRTVAPGRDRGEDRVGAARALAVVIARGGTPWQLWR